MTGAFTNLFLSSVNLDEIIKKTNPIRSNGINDKVASRVLLDSETVNPINIGPITEANRPKILKNP